jgi:DNA adenine methylase
VTKYMGSKAAHAEDILRVVLADRAAGQHYVEPFVGGGNVICRVPGEAGPRLGADKNKYMIALLDAVGNRGWLPPEMLTEAEWDEMRRRPEKFPSELVGLAGTGPTFGAKWFGGWARGLDNRGHARDYWREARDNVLFDAPGLRGCVFIASEYDGLSIYPESLVYCDPPYAETTKYEGAKTKIAVGDSLSQNSWDRLKFWRWADAQIDNGHKVFVSEYAGPPASAYKVTDPALIEERRVVVAGGKMLYERDQSPLTRTTDEERLALARRKADLERREQADRQRQADRWKIVWSKEVTSDFSSTRADDAKRETELLLTRT